jgi:hypothetical protein
MAYIAGVCWFNIDPLKNQCKDNERLERRSERSTPEVKGRGLNNRERAVYDTETQPRRAPVGLFYTTYHDNLIISARCCMCISHGVRGICEPVSRARIPRSEHPIRRRMCTGCAVADPYELHTRGAVSGGERSRRQVSGVASGLRRLDTGNVMLQNHALGRTKGP